MERSSTTHSSGRKDGFLLVGNHLALDFVNARPVQNGESVELLPDFSALLRWFQAAELLSAHDAASLKQKWETSVRARRTAEAIRALREKLRTEILRPQRGGAVHYSTGAELNRLLPDHPTRTQLNTRGNDSATELWLEPRQPEDFFPPSAYQPAQLLS